MNSAALTGLHAAFWVLAYVSAAAAGTLAAALARGKAYRPLRSLALREHYAVFAAAAAYLLQGLGLLALAPDWLSKAIGAVANGTLLHALALVAAALPPFARLGSAEAIALHVTADTAITAAPGPAKPSDSRYLKATRLGAALAGLGFALINLFVGTSNLIDNLALGLLALVMLALTLSVIRSALVFLAPSRTSPRIRKNPRGAAPAQILAFLALASYLAFAAFELLPQFLASGRQGRVSYYFFLAAFFIILNAGLALLCVRNPNSARAQASEPKPGKPLPADNDLASAGIAAGLSAREAEVAALLAQGVAYKDIADRLCVSLSTVQTHVGRIYAKLGVKNKTELSAALFALASKPTDIA